MSGNGYELFFGKQSPFSHHHACKFRVEKRDFHCMEQYMMYKKAEVFGDEDIMIKVMKSQQPAEIKRLGREVKDFDILVWMKSAVDIVKAGNLAKFVQNGDLRRELYNTYPKQLVEASPFDTRWGIGLSVDHPNARDESKWRGRNLLGKLLTNLRDELMMGENKIHDPTLPLLESDQSDIERKLLEENKDQKSRQASRERGQNWRDKNLQSREFEFFSGPESPFSNYHEAEFEIDGVKFCCIEHYVLYGKARLFGDKEALSKIRKIRKSSDLKKPIRVNPFDYRKWMSKRKDIYKRAAKAKFEQNPKLMEVLLNTFPKKILRMNTMCQQILISNPHDFRGDEQDEKDHWSEFALMEVRDKILGKDSWAEMSLNYSETRQTARRDNKRAGDKPRDDANKQKKVKHEQTSPDQFVDDVSCLFNEDLNIQSLENDHLSKIEDQNDPTSSKNAETKREERMDEDAKSTETTMDWFENGPSTSETVHSKKSTPKEEEQGSIQERTGSGSTRKKNEQTGSESQEKREDKRTGNGSTQECREEKHAGSSSPRKKWEQTGSETTPDRRDVERSGSNSPRKEKIEKESTRSERKKSKKKKKTKKENDKGTPKENQQESSEDAKRRKTVESQEYHPEETKPTKNYRKLKLSSLPNDKKYTFIDNTSPLSFEAECKFTIDDVVFNSVNHYTAYKKAELFKDDFRKDKIKDAVDAQVLRRLDSEVKNFDAKIWFENHVEFHKRACEAKFSQNPELKQQLFETYPTLIYKSGKSSRGRVTGIDFTKLDKQDRSNQQDVNTVIHDVRDELMRKEGLID